MTDDRSQFNYDEAKVPQFVLPPILRLNDGRAVSSREIWEKERRPEILELFETEVYGRLPMEVDSVDFNVEPDRPALDGRALERRVGITTSAGGRSFSFPLQVFHSPRNRNRTPVFLLINHRGRTQIGQKRVESMWFFPVSKILERGFTAAVMDANDLAPDAWKSFQSGVIEALYPSLAEGYAAMGALSAWAWGAMRVMDYFQSDPDIDSSRAAVLGHSRGGKAALWTGAMDERWAITISNQSGTGGAALSRRQFGETIQRINSRFGYWFTPKFRAYDENESALPIDQHALIALMAPRAVYVASAEEDLWADPRGEYLSLRHASEVYRSLYGMDENLPLEPPSVDQPLQAGPLGYHIRPGKHELLEYDWQRYMDFAETIYGLNR